MRPPWERGHQGESPGHPGAEKTGGDGQGTQKQPSEVVSLTPTLSCGLQGWTRSAPTSSELLSSLWPLPSRCSCHTSSRQLCPPARPTPASGPLFLLCPLPAMLRRAGPPTYSRERRRQGIPGSQVGKYIKEEGEISPDKS